MMDLPVMRCCVLGGLGFEREMETLVSRVIPDARRYGRARDVEVRPGEVGKSKRDRQRERERGGQEGDLTLRERVCVCMGNRKP
jgi:hypothetical protein